MSGQVLLEQPPGQRSVQRSTSRIPSNFGQQIEGWGYQATHLVTALVTALAGSILMGLLGVSSEVLIALVCLLLAPALVVMVIAIHYQAPPEKRIWSELGIIFAVKYAVLVSAVYYVQLTRVSGIPWDSVRPIVQDTGGILFTINILAYVFLCLSAGFAARVLAVGDGVSAWIRRLFILNLWLVFPTLMAPIILPDTVVSSAWVENKVGFVALLLWSVLFIPFFGLVSAHFHRLKAHRDYGVIKIR